MAIEESFLKSVFHGAIPEEMIFPYPEPPREGREAAALMLERLQESAAGAIDATAIDAAGVIPDAVFATLRSLGVFGLSIPTEFGGIGLDASGTARVLQELSSLDASVAVSLGAHLTLGAEAILRFGTTAQKKRWLPAIARGECIAAFALTEPGAGSDAAGIQTRAEPAPGGGFTLRGEKSWVTNGGIAGIFVVFARTTAIEDHSRPKITALVVERGDGVTNGPNAPRLGLRGASITTVQLDGVKVPSENVLGEVGKGFKIAMEVLNYGRLSLAAGCVGMSRVLLHHAVERAQERRAFGRSISEFGMVKDKIARMMAETWASESMVYLTAGLVDAKVPDWSLESAACKVFASEALWRVADEALQIAGGHGYASAMPYERGLRDARINPIFEGTSEILRAFVALSGMQGPARQLAEVGRAVREPIKGFGLLSDFALQKARGVFSRERMNRAHPSLRREVVLFEEHVNLLAKNVDKVLRKHGRDIAEMQYTQRRVADMATDLYALAAVLSRCTRSIERKGEEGARREIDLTAAFGNMAEKRLQANVVAFDSNDDELRKSIATQSCADGGYPFDVL